MDSRHRYELVDVLAKIKGHSVMDEFLQDILTPSELDNVTTRWQIVKQLSLGVPQRKIAKKLKVSIAKITRGSRELRNLRGGFRKILNT